MIKDYKDLLVWQKGRKLANEVYSITKKFPKEELFILVSQMRRSAISIPSNIAEGFLRGGSKDYYHFISIAIGSLAELETQIIIASDQNYIKDTKQLLDMTVELRKMLMSLRKKIKGD